MVEKTNKKTIGLDIKFPKETCEDDTCPFHGSLKVHGRTFVGRVVSAKMNKSVVISWDRRIYIPKYERYMVKTSKAQAHNPTCIDAKEGDLVKVIQCRPLSKLKNLVVVEVMEEEKKSN